MTTAMGKALASAVHIAIYSAMNGQLQVSGQQGGAILVFLPGAPEISRALRTLTGHDQLIAAAGGANRLRVVPLHGSLSAKDQSLVFNRYVLCYAGKMRMHACKHPAGTPLGVLAQD
jgi:HrpA-like RNA helicase